MKHEFNVVIERDSVGLLEASVPELPGCHTQARTLDMLEKRIREAIGLYLEDGGQIDEGSAFVGIHRVAVEA